MEKNEEKIKRLEQALLEMEARIQEVMLKSLKLESIGFLAGGIAHDFNNTLTAILGNISLAKMNMPSDSYPYRRLGETEKAAMKAKDLACQLLTFSKGGLPRKKVMSVVELIKDSTRFALAGSNVRVEYFFSPDLWHVDIDENQMTQVINNLVINAIQAMPKGGVIQIQVQKMTLRRESIKMNLEPGPFVSISFKDRGMGISKDHLSQIFDPFFTTKERGSGLGLYSAYSIVKNHGGNILVSSELGVGTKVTIYLPAVSETQAVKKGGEGAILTGTGKVLVVDDDELIRETAGAMLQHLGYEVGYASNGEEGIKLYKEATDRNWPFNALIVDLTMPGGIGGKETFQKILKLDPDVKAIVSSGYSEDPVIKHYREFGFREYLAKPYCLGTLSGVLRRVFQDKC